jgi:hypothetical protein
LYGGGGGKKEGRLDRKEGGQSVEKVERYVEMIGRNREEGGRY